MVDSPATVILQRVRTGHHTLQPSEMFEQRIARLWDQNPVAGITQQLEQQRVCLACTRRQDNVVRTNGRSPRTQIPRNGVSSHGQTERNRVVDQSPRVGQNIEEPGGIGQPYGGRVRHR